MNKLDKLFSSLGVFAGSFLGTSFLLSFFRGESYQLSLTNTFLIGILFLAIGLTECVKLYKNK